MAKFKYYDGSQWIELAAKSDLSGFLTNAIVSASVSGNTLTLTPASGSAVTFTPTMSGNYLPLSGGTITGNNAIYFGDSYYYIKRTDEGGSNYTLELGAPSLHITSSWEAEVAFDFVSGNNAYSIAIIGDSDDNAFWIDSDKDIMFRDAALYYGNSKTASNEIATHGWVNTQLGNYLPLSGGTLSGSLYFGDAYHRISQEDGSTITRAGGGTISVPTGSGTKGMTILADEGGDFGLLYVGSDGSVIANSGDNGYIFKVYDKDMNSSDFTSGTGFLFGVKQGGAGSAVAGDLEVGSVIYEGGTALSNKYQAKGTYAGTAVATQSANGLMSATDKTALDGIVASLNNDDSDSVVNRLKDVLSVFQDYPEGTTVLSALNSKLSLSGGTLTGSVTFANSTYNTVGDDSQIGDIDVAGTLGLRGYNGQTALAFVNQYGSSAGQYHTRLVAPVVYSNRDILLPSYSGTLALTSDIPSSLPASDVYPWAKASTKPSYSFSEISNRGEAFLEWGGQSLVGGFAPIDAAMVSKLSANRVAGISGDAITIERSSNGGSTWTTDTSITAAEKKAFFTTGNWQHLRTGSTCSVNDRLRITMNASDYGVYTAANKIMMYVSTSGSSGCTVYIDTEYYAYPGEWHEVGTFSLAGWSGWNVLNFSLPGSGCLGGSNSDYHNKRIRFTFACTGVDATYTGGLEINCAYIFGGVGWSTPSTLAANGVPYDYDADGNIYCATIVENGTPLGNKYLGINSNAASASIPYGFGFRGTNDWSGVAGTLATDWSVNGADIMFKYDGSMLNVITDGRFYQGIDIYGSSKRVLDEYDVAHTKWGDADTVDNKHASDFMPYAGNISGIGAGSPASGAKTYFENNISSNTVTGAYNTNGVEYAFLFSKAQSGSYGTILQWGYTDTYIRMLRYNGGAWQSNDWEKISAGYADSAGAVSWANVDGRPTDLGDFSNNYGYITSSALSGYATQSWVQTRGYVTILDIATTSKYGVTIMGSTEQYDPNPSLAVAGTVAPQGHTHSNYLTNAIVSASVSGNTLTLSPESGSAVTFTPTFTEQYTGTVKSVNNTSPDSNGNVSITIPTIPSSLPANGGSADYLIEHSFGSNEDSAMPTSGARAGFFYGTTSATGTDGIIIGMNWTDSSHYGAQLFIDGDPTYNISLRQRSSGGTWNSWVPIITANNISSYAITSLSGYATESWVQQQIPSSLPANGGSADYATSSTRLYASDSPYRYGDSNPYYAYMTYNSTRGQWYLCVYPESPKQIYVDNALNADYATSAGSAGSATTATSAGSATVADNVSYIDARSNTSNLPSSANTSGQLKFVLCASEPSTKYDGYVYLILS